jgi:uridine phosphorylase
LKNHKLAELDKIITKNKQNMPTPIAPSELIFNEDGSIYHLHLHPEQIADTIITVGDPDRVEAVSKHFDRIEHKVQKREFVTHTGYIGQTRLTVISTGIGTDNIDIVFNELDALANIDFQTRLPKEEHRALKFVRIGTSGSMQADIDVDEYVISAYGIGLDGLLGYYLRDLNELESQLKKELDAHLQKHKMQFPLNVEVAAAGTDLIEAFAHKGWTQGMTLTSTGFYAPQNRNLRGKAAFPQLFDVLEQFSFEGIQVTNLEMETAAIYGMANMFGHQGLSLNAILANRRAGSFSADPKGIVRQLILEALEVLTSD